MRFVDRGSAAAPKSLTKANAAGQTEFDRAKAHDANTDPKKGAFKYAVYKSDEVKRRLEGLFFGKCAYCESFFAAVGPVDVEHYRPKGAVAESPGHGGYWWLAMAWDNLLPSCIDCNRKRKQTVPAATTSLSDLYRFGLAPGAGQSGKKDSFPIAGAYAGKDGDDLAAELPLLLNPCRDKPEDHLNFDLGAGSSLALILPHGPAGLSQRGATSIQVYGLNRLGLVQARTRLLRQLRFLGWQVIELGKVLGALEAPAVSDALRAAGTPEVAKIVRQLQDRTFDEMRALADDKSPYSALATAWLRQFRTAAQA